MSGRFPKILAAEIGAELRQSLRAPEFLIPTLGLPVIFYLLFGIALAPGGDNTAVYLLATYGVFAVMGPSLFGFGAGVASDREKGWLSIKRASPAPALSFIAAKLFATIIFASLALMPIYIVAGFLGNVALPRSDWFLLLASHLLAVVPFSLLGLAIGFRFSSGAAIAVANIAFLSLAVLGGLWFPLSLFPTFLQKIAAILPSYHLGEIGLSIVNAPGNHQLGLHLVAVIITSIVLAAVAALSWSRQR